MSGEARRTPFSTDFARKLQFVATAVSIRFLSVSDSGGSVVRLRAIGIILLALVAAGGPVFGQAPMQPNTSSGDEVQAVVDSLALDESVEPVNYDTGGGYWRPDNGRFAVPIYGPGLRRLGPCPGACEVNWYAGQLWFRTELLAWTAKDSYLPALVTTGDSATPQADAGALDQADTVVLFGDQDFHDEVRLGGRLTAGWWCTPEQWSGVEAVFMGLGGEDVHFRANSDDYSVLAHPFTNVTNAMPESHLVAYPGDFTGETAVRVDSEMIGAEALFRQAVWWTDVARIDILGGYRHAHLYDRVLVDDFSTSLNAGTGFPVGDTVARQDHFQTENNFHGGEVGLAYRRWHRCWSCNLVSKFAYGAVFTKNGVFGETTVTDNSGVDTVDTVYEGGVYALPTNIGRVDTSEAAVLAELGFNLEYQLTHNTRVALGYSLLYWDQVTRAPGLVQTSINPTQIPTGTLVGAALPDLLLHHTSFWAQGLNASFEYQF